MRPATYRILVRNKEGKSIGWLKSYGSHTFETEHLSVAEVAAKRCNEKSEGALEFGNSYEVDKL